MANKVLICVFGAARCMLLFSSEFRYMKSCPTCVQLNYSSGSTFLPSIVNISEMAMEMQKCLKLKKKLQREIIK